MLTNVRVFAGDKYILNSVKPEIVNLLEETIWGKLHDIGLGSDFLTMTPKAHIQNQK